MKHCALCREEMQPDDVEVVWGNSRRHLHCHLQQTLGPQPAAALSDHRAMTTYEIVRAVERVKSNLRALKVRQS